MTQISFTHDEAHEALTQFLTDPDRERDGRRIGRNILDPAGDVAAVILDAAEHRELLDAYHAFNESQEPRDDADLPPGYRPYLHSPNATTDRLLPHEPLHLPLAHGMYGKPFEALDDTQQSRVIGIAIACLLRTTLDTDTQGVVPVLMYSHAPDDPEPRQFWQLAHKTDVPGLFLRGEAGFLTAEWAIVTGSGWKLASGWWDKDDAARAAAALARVLPFIDWMTCTPDSFTDVSKKAFTAVIRRHHYAGLREDQPEPQPLTAPEAAA